MVELLEYNQRVWIVVFLRNLRKNLQNFLDFPVMLCFELVEFLEDVLLFGIPAVCEVSLDQDHIDIFIESVKARERICPLQETILLSQDIENVFTLFIILEFHCLSSVAILGYLRA